MRVALNVVLFILLLVALQTAQAQTETVLYNFCSQTGCTDGGYPESSLISDGAGNFYGTTIAGGASGYGTVFELSPNGVGGYNENVLYSFCSLPSCVDGNQPSYSYLTFDSAGNLYGTTLYGGAYNYGTVFELSPAGSTWTEIVLHSFDDDGTDGYYPFAGLIWDTSGNLYGTTLYGSSGGSVYELSPNGSGGWNEHVIYNSGEIAGGLAIDNSGNLYGNSSGAQNGVFELSPNGGGWNATILHAFTGTPDGENPTGSPVLDKAGNIYGTTLLGGSKNFGTVWKLTRSGSKYSEKILHSFTAGKRGNCAAGKDGCGPWAGVVLDSSGNIFGTTVYGGNAACKSGCGTVYELAVHGKGYKEKILLPFNQTDGANPYGSLIMDGGNLYGMTSGGGTNKDGTVFELAP